MAVMGTSSARVTMWMLLVIYILNFLDRQIINILAEPIARDLDLSDTQLGLLTGLAFALFYALLGIPIARWADNSANNRVGLISVSLTIWSAMTAVSGLASNFSQLALARVGVGIGEAGCTPAAHSLISDTVPREKRASAIAFYGLGIPIGGLLGMIIGGQLAESLGWRQTFFIVGLPGIAVALLFWLVVPEPRKFGLVTKIPAATPVPFATALQDIRASRAFLPLATAAAVVAFLSYGKGVWTTIYFIRTHELSVAEVGLWGGLVLGSAGILGTWLGGKLSDHFGRRDARHHLTPIWVGMVMVAPLLFLGYTASDWRVALALIIVPTIANSMYYGPAYACAQGLVPPRSRAVAASLIIFAQNLVGLGLGPLLFGMLSDAFKPYAGTDSVQWVLYGAAFLGLVPAYFFWRASKHLAAELRTD